MNEQQIMEVAMLAGKIMLESGAETYRIEDTIEHILGIATDCKSEVFAMTTGIVATLEKEGQVPITMVKRVMARSTNLSNVVLVNDVSRRLCSGDISPDEAWDELMHLKKKIYPEFAYQIGAIGVTVGFVVMLGGNAFDALIGLLVGAALALMVTIGKKAGWNSFISDVVSCTVISFLTYVLEYTMPFSFDSSIVVTGAIMPLVPGISITNAVRDSLQGDFISGGARAMEAFLKAVAIAVGIGIGMICFNQLNLS